MNTKTPVNSDAETTRTNEKDAAKASYHQRLLPDHARPISSKQRYEVDVRRVGPLGHQPSTVNGQLFAAEDKPRHIMDMHSPLEPRYQKRPVSNPTAIASPEQNYSATTLATYSSPVYAPQRHQLPFVMGTGRTKKENFRAPTLVEQRSRNSLPAKGIPVLDLGRKELEGLPTLPFETERSSILSTQLGWESMQHELELLRKAVQEMHRTTRKQSKVSCFSRALLTIGVLTWNLYVEDRRTQERSICECAGESLSFLLF